MFLIACLKIMSAYIGCSICEVLWLHNKVCARRVFYANLFDGLDRALVSCIILNLYIKTMNLQDKNMLIERFARGRESLLIERYIKDGPADLSEQLGITPKEWKALFDHLVFE